MRKNEEARILVVVLFFLCLCLCALWFVIAGPRRAVGEEIQRASCSLFHASALKFKFGMSKNFVSRQAQVKMSKKMSFALRHGANQMNLTISVDGFVSVSELLRHSQFRGYTTAQLEECVATCEKQRFQLKVGESGEMFVRATQGHSISAIKDDDLLELITDPATVPVCLHGTYSTHIESIMKTGLNRMRRNNIHMISCLPCDESSVVSGMRYSADTIVIINVAKAMAAGIPFYRSSNDVILSPGLGDTGCIPPEFIVEVLKRAAHYSSRCPEKSKPDDSLSATFVESAPTAGKCGARYQPALGKVEAYTHYCVVDFEATCLDREVISPQEIIEFPAVVLSATTLAVITEFHSYVRPVHHPQLSRFCTTLTGITQSTVDAAPDFNTVLRNFVSFLESFATSYREEHEGSEPNVLFVSHGDWDFKTMLPAQCKTSGVQVPPGLTRWMNVKVLYSNSSWAKQGGGGKKRGMGMERMLADLGLELVGRHHSGIDDTRNIARILVDLVTNRGATPQVTADVTSGNRVNHHQNSRTSFKIKC